MKTLLKRFEIASASVAGSGHRAIARGNQDGVCVVSREDAIIAVVTDGCGSSPHSQVGALMGARMWVDALERELLANGGIDVGGIAAARDRVTISLEVFVEALPGERAEIVRDFFLFTAIGAVIEPELTAVFAIGDGVVGINESFMTLEPGEGNAPAYLGYELVTETAGLGEFSFIAVRPTLDVTALVLATDGATSLLEADAEVQLATLLRAGPVYGNADQLRRQLEALARTKSSVDWELQRVVRRRSLLSDDTTIVSICEAASCEDRA